MFLSNITHQMILQRYCNMIAEYEGESKLWVKHFKRNGATQMTLPQMCWGGAISTFVYWFLASNKKKKK